MRTIFPNRRAKLALAAGASLAALAAGQAQAGSFSIREQSAIGQGTSFAGVAAGSAGLGSIFWNPATMTLFPGVQSNFNATGVFPSSRIRVEAPTPTAALGGSGELGIDAVVPASYNTYQFNDSLFLGIATGGPFGFKTKPNFTWAGQVYSRSSNAISYNATPTVAYKVNEFLSIGAGLQIQFFDVTLKRAAGIAPGSPTVRLRGNDYDVGFTAGATFTPQAGTVIGIGYRSSINHDLEGTIKTIVSRTPIQASINLPDIFTVGVRQVITQDLTLTAGFEFANWSRFKVVPVVAQANGAVVTTLPFNYEDGYFVSAGAEYQFSPSLTLRTGFGYEWSPINTVNRGTRIPDADRVWASVGGTYKWSEKLSLDLGYSHIFVDRARIRIVPGQQDFVGLPFFGTADSSVDIVSVGATYRWDEPRRTTVPIERPIVRKY